MNTYHAHPLPWRDGFGSVLITVSNNARNMLLDAWDSPHRYRPMVFYTPVPTDARPTTTTTTTVRPTTTAAATTTTTSSTTISTVPPTSSTSTSTTSTSTTSVDQFDQHHDVDQFDQHHDIAPERLDDVDDIDDIDRFDQHLDHDGASWLTHHGRAQRVPHRRPDFP